MADLTKTVKVAFLGEDKVTKTIDGITGRIDSFAGRVSDATQPLANLTDNILKTEAALAALAIGGMALAFNEFSKFESASAELAKVLDLQTESLDEAQAKAIEFSGTYGEAAENILQSFAGFRQAGFDLAEAMTLTKDSIEFAIAGDMELAEATEIVISSLKGFKLGADEARAVIDALNETSNNYATNAQELGQGLALLSPIARQMGFTFQETIGLLTPIIEVFRSGSEAGNAMKTTLLKLQADRTTDTLKELHISQRDLNGEMRSGKDILIDVFKAFEGLGETEKAYYAQQLTGIHQAGKAVEVFTQFGKVIGVTEGAYDSFGSVSKEVEIRLKTAEIQMDRFVVAIKNIGAAVGAELAPGFTTALTSVTDFINELRKLIGEGDAFAPLFKVFSDLGFDIAKIFDSMKVNLEGALEDVDLDKFIESIEGVIDEVVGLFKSFFGDIDLTSKEGLETFIQRVIDSFTSLNNIVIGILGAFEPFVEKIGELAEKFADLNAEDAKSIGNFLGWAKVINTVANNIGALTGSLNYLAQGLTLLTGVKILAAIKGLNQAGTAASGLMGILGKLNLILAAPFVGYWLGSVLRDNIPFIKEWGDELGEILWKLKDNEETMRRTAAAQYTEELGKLAVSIVQFADSLDEVPREKVIDFQVDSAEYQTEYDKILKQIQDFPETKDTKLTLTADEAAAKKAFETIQIWVEDAEGGGGYWLDLKFEVDKQKLEDTKKALEEIPAEKIIIAKLENQTELEIAKIVAGAETIQTAIKWKAEIDIEETKQAFETLRFQGQNIRDMFLDTGDVIQGMASALGDLGPLGRSDLLQLMEKEIAIRASLAEQQGKLTEAEIKYIEAKTEALASGDAFINIQVDGVYPELELIMHKLIEQTQIRANAEGLEFLLGS